MPSTKYGLRARRCQEAIIRGVICLPASKIRSRGEIKDRVDIAVAGQWRLCQLGRLFLITSTTLDLLWSCPSMKYARIAQWPHKDEHYLRVYKDVFRYSINHEASSVNIYLSRKICTFLFPLFLLLPLPLHKGNYMVHGLQTHAVFRARENYSSL